MKPLTRFWLSATTLVMAGFLAACGGDKKSLHLFTWAEYIDPDLVTAFEEANHCRLVIDTFDSNESMLAKLQAGATGYDVVVPSSYMAAIMWDEGLIQEIDHAKVPNLKNVDPAYLKTLAFDKDMKYSVPYMLSNTGIAYSVSKLGDVDPSWAIFDRTDLKNRMTLLNDVREALGAALKFKGYSLNTTNQAEIDEAVEVLKGWKENLAKFDSESYKPGIGSGEFFAVQGYSGDLLQVMDENEDIGYYIPKEGTSIACDDLVILKNAPEPDLAYAFIDFLTDAENAAQNTEFVYFLAPNAEAYKLLSEEVRSNTAVFPPSDVLEKSEVIKDLGEQNQLYSKAWDRVKSGN